MDDHALAVDIADLESRHLSATRAGGVEGHHQDAVEGGRSGIDESGDFLLAEYGGQATHLLGEGVSSIPQRFLRVLRKKKRRAANRCVTLVACSFRSRNRYAWYSRTCSGRSWSGERWK
jgi:hypothetical protein